MTGPRMAVRAAREPVMPVGVIDGSTAALTAAALSMMVDWSVDYSKPLSPLVVSLRDEYASLALLLVDAETPPVDPDDLVQPGPRHVDLAAAAKQLGWRPDTLRWHCRRGRFGAVKKGGRWFVDAGELAAEIEART